MKIIETILGVSVLVVAPLLWGMAMSWVFARWGRNGEKTGIGNGS